MSVAIDDCIDAGGRTTLEAKVEKSRNGAKSQARSLVASLCRDDTDWVVSVFGRSLVVSLCRDDKMTRMFQITVAYANEK